MSVGRITIPDQLYLLTQEENLPLVHNGERVKGKIKVYPKDFQVTEIPAFTPSGEGEFLYLFMEKTGLDTGNFLRVLGEITGLKSADIGYAGMKDKQAITRQWISVPARVKTKLSALDEHPDIRILDTQRHEHRLRMGKLRGNHFDILVRTDHEVDSSSLERTAEKMRNFGMANFFGEQRFGHRGQTASIGFALLKREQSNRARKARRSRFMKKLALSAAQSLLFNRIVQLRHEEGNLWEALSGDIFQKSDSGGLFLSEDPVQERKRMAAGEISPTGAIFGRKDRWKEAPPREIETRVWDESGFDADVFEGWGKMTLGGRRPLLVRPEGLTCVVSPEGFRLQFALPAGTYATVLLREFYQKSPDEDAPDEAP